MMAQRKWLCQPLYYREEQVGRLFLPYQVSKIYRLVDKEKWRTLGSNEVLKFVSRA